MIFWKSAEGKLRTEENLTSGTASSSESGSIRRSFCILCCLMEPFSNLRPRYWTMPSV